MSDQFAENAKDGTLKFHQTLRSGPSRSMHSELGIKSPQCAEATRDPGEQRRILYFR